MTPREVETWALNNLVQRHYLLVRKGFGDSAAMYPVSTGLIVPPEGVSQGRLYAAFRRLEAQGFIRKAGKDELRAHNRGTRYPAYFLVEPDGLLEPEQERSFKCGECGGVTVLVDTLSPAASVAHTKRRKRMHYLMESGWEEAHRPGCGSDIKKNLSGLTAPNEQGQPLNEALGIKHEDALKELTR